MPPAAPACACPACGYPLPATGTPTVTCPECGQATDVVALAYRSEARLRLALTLLAGGLPVVLVARLIPSTIRLTTDSGTTSSPIVHMWPLLLPATIAALLGMAVLAITEFSRSPGRARTAVSLCIAGMIATCLLAAFTTTPSAGRVTRLPEALGLRSDQLHTLARTLAQLITLGLLVVCPALIADLAAGLRLTVLARWCRRLPLLAPVQLAIWFFWLFWDSIGAPLRTTVTSPAGNYMRLPEWYSILTELSHIVYPFLANAAYAAVWCAVLVIRAHPRLPAVSPPAAAWRPPPPTTPPPT